MDRIYRKISLEDFKNRYGANDSGGTEAVIGFDVEWGNIGYDYILDPDDDLITAYNVVVDGNRVRFATLKELHAWLSNILLKSKFYKLCGAADNKQWRSYKVEDINEENIVGIYNTLPEPTGDAGDIVWITPEAVSLNEKFESSDSGLTSFSCIKAFNTLYENARLNQATTETPYVDVNIMLTETVIDEGMYTKADWDEDSGETESASWETSVIGESKLSELKRHKRSYDDYGNELPFIIEEDASGATAETFYLTGVPYNVEIREDGRTYGDYIETITFGEDSVFFKYHTGVWVIHGGNEYIFIGEGVKYEERYPFEEINVTIKYNGENVTFAYKNIFYDKQYDIDEFSSGSTLWSEFKSSVYDRSKQYAEICYETTYTNEDKPLIKEDALAGYISIIKDGAPRVERGTAAAFEIHNILGECRTMDDLEKYRNDFFTIKDDEKE